MRSWLVLMIGLAACGNDDGGGGPFAPIDQLTSAYRQAYCPHFVACGEFPDLPTCLGANIGATAVMIDPSVIAAVFIGTVIYDGNKMEECFVELAAASCDTTLQESRVMPDVCSQTLRGTIAGGDACFLDVECVSQVCNIINCAQSPMCCAGTCAGDAAPVVQPIAIGQPCNTPQSTSSCVVGAYCNGVCTMLQPAGTSCEDISQCDYGLGCTGAGCQQLPAVGEPCPFGQCRDEGAVCSTTTMTCEPVGLEGATCTAGTACSPFYLCDATSGQCVPGPRFGESCSTGARCFDADAYCDPISFVCTKLSEDGAPCTSGNQCTSGQCPAGTCAEPTACMP